VHLAMHEGDRVLLDGDVMRIVVPVRLQLRGGRTAITAPNGKAVVAKPRRDHALIKGLRAGW